MNAICILAQLQLSLEFSAHLAYVCCITLLFLLNFSIILILITHAYFFVSSLIFAQIFQFV